MYFSARSASWAPLLFQQITRCHSVFSCFSPPCPVHCRLVASDSVATREPLAVLRTSGSAPKFPISMTLFRLRLTKNLRTLGGSETKAAQLRDEERHTQRHALREVAARPGIGEYGALDRGDVVDVSRRGRTNPGKGGRGAPPIGPALRQGVRRRVRQWPHRRVLDPRRRARAGRAASSRLGGGSRTAREARPPKWSSGPRNARYRRPPRGGGALGRPARARPASAPWAAPRCPPGRGGRRTSRRIPDRAARRNRPPRDRCRRAALHRRPRP